MHWVNSSTLTRKLRQIFAEASTRGDREYTFEHLLNKVAPANPAEVSVLLARMGAAGDVTQKVLVSSPAGGRVAEFDGLADVPDRVYDPIQDAEISVEPSLLRIIYRPGKRGTLDVKAEPQAE